MSSPSPNPNNTPVTVNPVSKAVKITFILSVVLLIVGGLNWGLYAISPSYNIVDMLLGGPSGIGSRIVYALVAFAALLAAILSCLQPSVYAP